MSFITMNLRACDTHFSSVRGDQEDSWRGGGGGKGAENSVSQRFIYTKNIVGV